MDIVITAANLAAIYGLVAIGLSVTWAGLGLLNLAHGATFAISGYGAWWAAQNISADPIFVVAAGVLTGALAGGLLWLAVFVPLDGRPNWDVRALTATLALSMVAINGLLEVFGPGNKSLPSIFGDGKVTMLDSVITAREVGTFISATVVLALVLVGLRRSRVGLGVRALSQNVEGTILVGLNRDLLGLAILSVSGALAGLASVLLSQVFFVSPQAGIVPMVIGLIVALLGGLGSVGGTIGAACLVGAVETLTATYLGGQYVLMTLFLLIGVVLFVRPRGLGGILESTRA